MISDSENRKRDCQALFPIDYLNGLLKLTIASNAVPARRIFRAGLEDGIMNRETRIPMIVLSLAHSIQHIILPP